MNDRRGFSLIELVLVLAVGGLLAAVAVNTFTSVQPRMATRSADSGFQTLHAQARAYAVERGTRTRFVVDAGQNRVSVFVGVGADEELVRSVDFLSAYNVEIDAAGSPVQLCMSPRGFGEVGCNSFTNAADVTFRRAGESRSVRILPLGQLIR